MRSFFKGSIYISAFIIVLASIISCEEDFTDIGTSIIVNNKFSTNDVFLDLDIKPINIASVDADKTSLEVQNVGVNLVGYRLGVYATTKSKKIRSGFVTQLSLPSENLRTQQDGDTVFKLDKVFLKIPYKLDSVLGNKNALTKVKVYRNPTFLHILNPNNLLLRNRYSSDFNYNEKDEDLLTNSSFTFTANNIQKNTSVTFYRPDRSENSQSTDSIKDVLKLENAVNEPVAFLAIPLDLERMQSLFWDKFENSQFQSKEAFQNYFRGLIVKAEGDDGALVPINIADASQGQASLDFLYSKTVEKDTVITDTYSFPFNTSVQNNIYDVIEDTALPKFEDNFLVQGLAGVAAEISILGVNLSSLDEDNPLLLYRDKDIDANNYLDLKELASIRDIENNDFGLLANEATIFFNINEELSSGVDAPNRLYIYSNNDEGKSPMHLSDSFSSNSFPTQNSQQNVNPFGVISRLSDGQRGYVFNITDYISKLLNGSSEDFSPLVLKVFNPTDNPTIVGALNSVTSYNWDPSFVILKNGNDKNGVQKAQMKLSFTSKNN